MKKNICIIAFILVTTAVVAQGYTDMPTYEFQSVNNTTVMSGSSGVGSSAYSSTIYDVGAESPTSGRRAGARKAAIGGGSITGDLSDEEKPGLPIGDAVLPLLLMAALAGVVTYVRRGRYANRTPAANRTQAELAKRARPFGRRLAKRNSPEGASAALLKCTNIVQTAMPTYICFWLLFL